MTKVKNFFTEVKNKFGKIDFKGDLVAPDARAMGFPKLPDGVTPDGKLNPFLIHVDLVPMTVVDTVFKGGTGRPGLGGREISHSLARLSVSNCRVSSTSI